jgi:lipopolysaccharide export system protein LptA
MKNNLLSHIIRSSFAAFMAGVMLQAAHAEKADFDKPTQVEANHGTYDEAKQTNVFTGNVVLTRGTLIMHADKMTVRKDAAGNQFATLYAAPGGVTKFRQKRDGGKDMWIDGSASDRIEYDTKTEIAKLFKNAKIKMTEAGKITDEVEGEFVSYDSRTEFYTVTNSTSGESKPGTGRVRVVIQPRNAEK